MRYCAKRAHHYALLVDATTALSLLGGSAAGTSFLGSNIWVGYIGAGLVVASSLASLAFRWPDKARFWQDQRTRYGILEERFYRLGSAMTEADLNDFKAAVAALEADAGEGRTLNALMTICHNEEYSKRGTDGHRKLYFWQRMFANIADLPPVVWE